MLQADLERLRSEYVSALAQLGSTKAALRAATDQLELADKRKRKLEKAVCFQLTETRAVLRKTKHNLESCSGGESTT